MDEEAARGEECRRREGCLVRLKDALVMRRRRLPKQTDDPSATLAPGARVGIRVGMRGAAEGREGERLGPACVLCGRARGRAEEGGGGERERMRNGDGERVCGRGDGPAAVGCVAERLKLGSGRVGERERE